MVNFQMNKAYYHSFLWYLASKNITPNDVTVSRTIMFLAVIIVWGIARYYEWHILLLILLVVSVPIWFLDMVDGDLARVTNQMTEKGKWLDPLADKIKFYLAMFAMSPDLSFIQWFMILIIFAFDVLSTLQRGFDSTKKVDSTIVGANIFGKMKLVFQVVTIIAFALYIYAKEMHFLTFAEYMYYLANISLILAIILALVSVWQRIKWLKNGLPIREVLIFFLILYKLIKQFI